MNANNLLKRLSALALVIMAGMMTAVAADFEFDGISYNVIGENEVEVTTPDSDKYAGEVIIPATVVNDGTTYSVTRIGDRAFSNCINLTLVGIPEGVTEIGNTAFYNCSNLENIDLPNSLIKIGKSAFNDCRSFTTFHIPRNLAEIGYDIFQNCTGILYFTCSSLNQHFKVVDGVLYSKDMTMLVWYPTGAPATSFAIPNTVTALHDYCFSFNTNLEEVTFPESVTWMGMNIFRGCTGITEVDLPDGVTHMGITVFGSCSNLTRVHLPASLDSLMGYTFSYCENLTEVTIPRNVSFIGEMSFLHNTNLEAITFEAGSRLQAIDQQAFYECVSLKNLEMPNTVTSLGRLCFYRCHSLKSAHLSESLTEMGNAVFWDCLELTESEIPATLTTVDNVFINCPALKRLIVGRKDATPGTTLLQRSIAAQCNQVEYLELGANVDSLASSALSGLDSLKVVISWATVPPRCDSYWSTFSPSTIYSRSTLYVPRESLEAYLTANEWKKFNTIEAIEDVGDVDGNGSVGIGDITELIDQILSGEIVNPALADVYLDGKINISDVTELIDKVLGCY